MPIIQGGLIIENVQPYPIQLAAAPVTAVNEVQTLTQTGAWTSGTFLLSIFGQTTAPIAFGATGAQVATALNLLSAVGASGFGGSGAAGGPFVLTASGGNVKARDIPLITCNTAGIVGGGVLTPVETTKGVTASGYGTAKGTQAIDAATGLVYVNTGTATAPVMTKVGAQV